MLLSWICSTQKRSFFWEGIRILPCSDEQLKRWHYSQKGWLFKDLSNQRTNKLFQKSCENLSLIKSLGILVFLGKWHILKWEAKFYSSKSEWLTALNMFKKCESVEAIELMNHAKEFDGSQLLTDGSLEDKKKRCCQDSYTWIISGICVIFRLHFSSSVLFLNLMI